MIVVTGKSAWQIIGMRHTEGRIVQSVPDEEMIEGCNDCCIFAGRWAGRTVGVRYIKSQIYKSVPAETAMIVVLLQGEWYDRL